MSEIVKRTNNNITSGVVDDYCVNGATLDDTQKKACTYQRNVVVGDLIGISDVMCNNHIKTIYGNEASFNILTGTFTNAFSGAATVVGGPQSKSVLSALVFFFNAERSLTNETIYKSIVVPAVTKKINDMRTAKRSTLLQKYQDSQSQDYIKYPINIAMMDVLDYHLTCSFMRGLEAALAEGTQGTTKADMLVLEDKLKKLSDQIEQRAKVVGDKTVTDSNIQSDPFLKDMKSRYDAINEKLKALEINSKQ